MTVKNEVSRERHGKKVSRERHGNEVSPERNGNEVSPERHGNEVSPERHGKQVALELAGVWPRIMALVYESLIVAAILFLATALAMLFTQKAIAPGTVWFELYLVALLAGYFCYCWMRSGQTAGMFAWRILLTDVDGKRVNLATALLRFFVATLLGFGILGLLWALFDIDRVALQDRLTGTRVLRLPKPLRA